MVQLWRPTILVTHALWVKAISLRSSQLDQAPRPSRSRKCNVYALFLMILLSPRKKIWSISLQNVRNDRQKASWHGICMHKTSMIDIIFNVHTLEPSFLWSLAQVLRKQGSTPFIDILRLRSYDRQLVIRCFAKWVCSGLQQPDGLGRDSLTVKHFHDPIPQRCVKLTRVGVNPVPALWSSSLVHGNPDSKLKSPRCRNVSLLLDVLHVRSSS